MSELHNFDKYFKQKMEDYSPPVPENIWANIMAEKDKRRPVAFLFKFFNSRNMLLVAAMLVLVAGSIFTFKHTGNRTNSETIDSAKIKNRIDDKITTQNNSGTLNNTTTENVKVLDSENLTQKSTAEHSIYADNNKTSTTGNANDGVVKNKEVNNVLDNKEKESLTIIKNKAAQPKVFITRNKKLQIKSVLADADKTDNGETPTDQTVRQENNSTSDELLFKLLYYPEKNKTAFTLKNSISSNFLLPPCPEIEKNAAGNKDYIEAYIGPDFAYKSYTDTSNSLLMQKRKESISFHSAFSAGFRYTRVFSNGVSIRGGINYSQINEKFTYVQSNIVQVTYIIDPSTGDTTGSYITNGSRYKTTYNHYRTVDVPIVFGFETGNGRIHANLNAGMVFNIRSWQNGETIGLDSSAIPIIVNTGKGNTVYQYKTNIGAGFITSASIYYKLNDRFHLLAEPYWRYNFSPMSKEALSLQEKYSSIGLRLGLRMDLQY